MSSLLNREDVITAIERHAEAVIGSGAFSDPNKAKWYRKAHEDLITVVGMIPGVKPWNNCKHATPICVCEIFSDEGPSFCVEGPCSYYEGKE